MMTKPEGARRVEGERPAHTGALVGSLVVAAGVVMGIGMGMKMRGGANRVERRVEDYRGAWHQVRGR